MTRITKVIDEKDIAEDDIVGWDFTDMVSPGETIVSAVVTCEVYSGSDPNPSAVLSGSPQISGLLILHQVVGGVRGTQYHLRCEVQLSPWGALTQASLMPVMRV